MATTLTRRMVTEGDLEIRTAGSSTVTKQIKTRYWSTDWDSFKTFVKENDALDLFEQRIAQKNMNQFLKENPTKIPVGLQTDRRYAVLVVKPRTKAE